MRARIFDFSHHNAIHPSKVVEMADAAFIRIGHGKTPDETFQSKWDALDAYDFDLAPYHFFEHGISPYEQMAMIKTQLGSRVPNFSFAEDFEWNSGAVTPEEAYLMMLLTQDFQNRVVSFQRPSIIYTAPGWWNWKTTWAKKYDLWNAQWPGDELDWANLWIPDYRNPWYDDDFDGWRFWQFTGHGLAAGAVDGNVDKSVFNGTHQEMRAYYNITKDPCNYPKPTPVAYKVTATAGLRVRNCPSTSCDTIGGLPYGSTIYVYDVISGWGKISADKEMYSSMLYLEKV